MEREFEINGQQFQLNKINAFKQFHIVRRIAPVLSELLPVLGEVNKVSKSESSMTEVERFDQIAKIAAPFLAGFSKLSDVDSDKVLYGLLSSVEVKQSIGWARVATESTLMMQDMELTILLQIAGRAFMFNLSGFFRVLPQVT